MKHEDIELIVYLVVEKLTHIFIIIKTCYELAELFGHL